MPLQLVGRHRPTSTAIWVPKRVLIGPGSQRRGAACIPQRTAALSVHDHFFNVLRNSEKNRNFKRKNRPKLRRQCAAMHVRMYSSISSQLSCCQTVEECLRLLRVDAAVGLTFAEVAVRLRDVGRNELDRGEIEPVWKKFLDKLREPMIALLLGSAGVSLLLGQFDDFVSISLAVVIVVTVACVQEYKSDQSIAALSKLTPHRSKVLRESRCIDVDATDLVPGDIVILSTGDRVAADIRLIQVAELAIDESSLTGETEPSLKTTVAVCTHLPRFSPTPASPAATSDVSVRMDTAVVPVAERTCVAYMGTLVCSGRGMGIVTATGMGTELGAIVGMMDEAEERKSPLQEAMDALAHKLTMLSFAVISVIFLLGITVSHVGILEMFNIGVSLAVAAIPEGLPIVVTVTLALGVQRMAAKKAVVKKLPAVEALGSASIICVDKTGTLTRNEMTAIEMFSLVAPGGMANVGGSQVDVGGAAAMGRGQLDADLYRLEALAADPVAAHAALCGLLGRGVGSRVLLRGLGYEARGWGEWAVPHVTGQGGGEGSGEQSNKVTATSAPHIGVIAEAGAVCNDAKLVPTASGGRSLVGQPTEGALLVAADKLGCGSARQAWTRTSEVPFSSESKWMAVRAHRTADGPDSQQWWFAKGSTDAIVNVCTHALVPQGSVGKDDAYAASLLGSTSGTPCTVAPMAASHRAYFAAAGETLAREGLRVLALAKGTALPGPNGVGKLVLLGLVGLHDPPREGVMETIRTLHDGGVRVVMITGDGQSTALAIAAHLGIEKEKVRDRLADSQSPMSPVGLELGAEHEVDTDILVARSVSLSGTQVESMGEEELARAVPNVRVFYRTTPRHKMKIVRAFQACGEVVAMTGDGVNDAPALKVADIGVAMGKGGTDVAKEAADMVLTDDNFCVLVGAIEEGKGIFANIRNFVRFQLSTSIAALSLVAACSLLGLPNPLNAMQILWINILMDGPPAQSLGVEPVDPAVMRKPPRRRDEPIITTALVKRVVLAAAIIMAGTLWVFIRERHDGDPSALSRDTTMTFTTFVMFDMFNALACRSAERSIFELGLFSNGFFLAAVGGSVVGQLAVVYLPPLQSVFKTEALSLSDWLFIIVLTSSVLWVDEAIKLTHASGLGQEEGEAGLGAWGPGESALASHTVSTFGRAGLRFIRGLPGGRQALGIIGMDPYRSSEREDDEEEDALLTMGGNAPALSIGSSRSLAERELVARKTSTSAQDAPSTLPV